MYRDVMLKLIKLKVNIYKLQIAFLTLFLSPINGTCQIGALSNDSPVKWKKPYVNQDSFIHVGIDTLTNDKIEVSRNRYKRISHEGQLIEILKIDRSLSKFSCSDDGFHLSGWWEAYFSDGQLKESGNIVCNFKVDEWFYFYPDGSLRKYENYLRLDRLLQLTNRGYLSGNYIEYHTNGNKKIAGVYKIVEEYAKYFVVNIETYEIDTLCCEWEPVSVKHGIWKFYDESGSIIREIDETINLDTSDVYREVTDRYIERLKKFKKN